MVGNTHTRNEARQQHANPLLALIAEAQRAMPYTERARPGDLEPLRIAKRAAAARTLVLKSTPLPTLFNAEGRMMGKPTANLAGETMTLGAAIVQASRTAQAGANLIVLEERPEPQFVDPQTGAMSMYEFPGEFVSVDPAPFAEVEDDEDTPETERPIHVAEIARDGRQFGVRFKVNRAEQKRRGEQQVADEMLLAIVSGVAQAADLALLEAIKAVTPAAFTLGAAAAAGVRVGDLHALVGTGAAGAEFRADGQLVAAGIRAELTPGIAETIVGDFNRAALVVGPELTIMADRMNTRGDVTVQAWLNIDAAVPDRSKFWTVAGA
jgi:hypothetical protein